MKPEKDFAGPKTQIDRTECLGSVFVFLEGESDGMSEEEERKEATDSFGTFHAEVNEGSVSGQNLDLTAASLAPRPRIKLETLSGRKISLILRQLYLAFFVSFISATVTGVVCDFVPTYHIHDTVTLDSDIVEVEYVCLPRAHSIVNLVFESLVALATGILAVAFTYRILRLPREQRNYEQQWTMVLIWCIFLRFLPLSFSLSSSELGILDFGKDAARADMAFVTHPSSSSTSTSTGGLPPKLIDSWIFNSALIVASF